MKPYVRCPSAMKCVEKINCDFDGFMTDDVLDLTPELEMLRVPLIVRKHYFNLSISIFFKHCSLVSTELEVIRLMFVVEIPITKILGLKTTTTTTTTTTSHNSNSKEETQIRIQTIREEIRIGIRTLIIIREGMLLYQRRAMQTRSQQRHQREGRTPMESEC